LTILGATGSIGESTAEVLRNHPEKFKVRALTARCSVGKMLRLVEEFQPEFVAMTDPEAAEELRRQVGSACRIGAGMDACVEAATLDGLDIVVSAMVGAAGLAPVYAALEKGTDIALANKEVLVAAGEVVKAMMERSGARLLPVDSEHSALFQALSGHPVEEVRNLWITASGGPFRGRSRKQLRDVAVEEALKHPTWEMGAKITIDSASMMNKGLEVVEAHWLFDIPFERIQVVVHPQSILHSLVEFVDGSWLAQLGVTDMKVPIQYALSYPARWPADYLPRLPITKLRDLTFEEPDPKTFENLALAYEAGRRGKTFACVLSAANEVAVEAFLDRRLGFLEIAAVNRHVLEAHDPPDHLSYESVVAADAWGREEAKRLLASGKKLCSSSFERL
jgi:1-deoxy-D-xylulose-5-phosphate reductoisomerase